MVHAKGNDLPFEQTLVNFHLCALDYYRLPENRFMLLLFSFCFCFSSSFVDFPKVVSRFLGELRPHTENNCNRVKETDVSVLYHNIYSIYCKIFRKAVSKDDREIIFPLSIMHKFYRGIRRKKNYLQLSLHYSVKKAFSLLPASRGGRWVHGA